MKFKASNAYNKVKAGGQYIASAARGYINTARTYAAPVIGAARTGFNAGRYGANTTMPMVPKSLNNVAFAAGRAAGAAVRFSSTHMGYIVQGTKTAAQAVASALRQAGAKVASVVRIAGRAVAWLVKIVSQQVVRGAKWAANQVDTVKSHFNVKRMGKGGYPKNYQPEARSNVAKPKRTIRNRIITGVDNAYIKLADKIVPSDYGSGALRRNPDSKRAANKAAYSRPKAVNMVATGLEVATATLGAAGVSGLVFNLPSKEDKD